jgi:hypothetical protein
MSSFPWNTPSARTTGIAAQAITAAAGFIGDEIDNSANLDNMLDLDITFTCAVAPTADTVIYVYLLYSDGTTYDDGGTALQPKKLPISQLATFAVTTAQKRTIDRIQIPPKSFKIMLWNAINQTATCTVTAKTYRTGYAA